MFVDKTPPEITKEYIGPQIPDPIDDEPYPHYISPTTSIVLDATDQDPHPSGLSHFEYRVSLVNDNACESENICNQQTGTGEFMQGGEFQINEESCHLIEAKAIDNVGKSSELKQCVFVDARPPEIEKTVSDPKISCEEEIQEPVLCNYAGCFEEMEKDFFTTGRHDPSNWDIAIWNGNPEQVESSGEFPWIS
jgi:hypothetical protein